jgi:hypothetical protein
MTGLHFTMSAEFATNQARTFWAEGRYRLVYEMLWAFGMSIEDGEAVIRGKKKFMETGDDNSFVLANDDWHPNLAMCHRCRYPNPASSEMATIDREAEDALSFYRQYKEFVDDVLAEGSRVTFGRGARNELIESYLDTIREQDKVASSTPKPGGISPFGVISPEGEFFTCEYWMHDALCAAFGYTGRDEAMSDGYILVSSGVKGSWVAVGGPSNKSKTLTDAQRATLKEWANLFDKDNYVGEYKLLREGAIRL